jgi:uncharacterized protein
MTPHDRLCRWLLDDPWRMHALEIARALALPDWSIAAGFVRNLAWDRLHGFSASTPLQDIYLIYFDAAATERRHERDIETALAGIDASLPWSVRNQARMHKRNGDAPYASSIDAMRNWVEIETAVGARIDGNGQLRIIAPFGLDSLFAMRISPNLHPYKPDEFNRRVAEKNWLRTWPALRIDRLAAENQSN